MLPPLRRVVVGGRGAAADAAQRTSAHATPRNEAASVGRPESSSFDSEPKGILGAKARLALAQQLTPADFSLEPGAPAISAKALVTDAVAMLSETGVGALQALTTASTRLGFPIKAVIDNGGAPELFEALGPASLPLLDSRSAVSALSKWKLDAREVVPELLERARFNPDLGQAWLAALARNAHLDDLQVLAVQDAAVRSATLGATQAPVFDASMTIDRLINDLRALGQGEVFAQSLPVVSRLLKGGGAFDVAAVAELADRALESPDLGTRVNAGALFWHSSDTSEVAIQSYLKSLVDHGPEWSRALQAEVKAAFEANPSWEQRAREPSRLDERVGLAIGYLLESAPAWAGLLPVELVSHWPSGNLLDPRLVDKARSAVAWSTLPPERVIAAADTLDHRLESVSQRADVLPPLLKKYPHLARSAPRLLAALSGTEFTTERLANAKDFFAELRAMRAELEAMPLPPNRSAPEEQRARAVALSRFDRVLSGATKERVIDWLERDDQHWQEQLAVEQGRMLRLSPLEMLEVLLKRPLRSTPAILAAAELLVHPTVPEALFKRHFAELVMSPHVAGAPRVKLLEALLRQVKTKTELVELLSPLMGHYVVRVLAADDLLAAGFSHELALAGTVAEHASMFAALASSHELPRGVNEALETRLVDFRQRASDAARTSPHVRLRIRARQEPRSSFERGLAFAFSDQALTSTEPVASALRARDDDRDVRFVSLLVDLRRGATYAELREKYGPPAGPRLELRLNWAHADSASPEEQQSVLLSGAEVAWETALTAPAASSLTQQQRERLTVNAISRELLRDEGPTWSTAMQALVDQYPGSLDFLAPTMVDLSGRNRVGRPALASVLPLLISPKLSKAAALDLVWRWAERSNTHSSLGASPVTASQLDANAMTFALIEDFIQGRSDLSEAERAHLLGALGYLTQMDPYIVQRRDRW